MSYNVASRMSAHEFLSASVNARYALAEYLQGGYVHPGPSGILSGLLYREIAQHDLCKEDIPLDSLRRAYKLQDNLPLPYAGMHPHILYQLVKASPFPESEFWREKFSHPYLPAKTRYVSTESGIDNESIAAYREVFDTYLPSGSLTVAFATNGPASRYARLPMAKYFATASHQMSLPDRAVDWARHIPSKAKGAIDWDKGFNMMVLSTQPSPTTPKEWYQPFPGGKNEQQSALSWGAMHQVAHMKVIPTCWEYVDRTYSLLTPTELVDLTVRRQHALNSWFARYYSHQKSYIPDSTSYLYEIKIIQRAQWLERQIPLDSFPKTDPEEELFWFQGYHFDEICEQLQHSDRQKHDISRALRVMDAYLLQHHNGLPTNPYLNSAVFSTDYGTHAVEEIVVDAYARFLTGTLSPEMKVSWSNYFETIESYWKRWESAHG